jgi:heme oxygenase
MKEYQVGKRLMSNARRKFSNNFNVFDKIANLQAVEIVGSQTFYLSIYFYC